MVCVKYRPTRPKRPFWLLVGFTGSGGLGFDLRATFFGEVVEFLLAVLLEPEQPQLDRFPDGVLH